ncbi:GerMN domain-containing protein [Paenibacillus sp. MBLB4367]|uniref:GerMN domain-containing protein n=1 Tax=Paenibacillus sp. MBLB4367 TaxID=3384767 RepID=UPI00390813AD
MRKQTITYIVAACMAVTAAGCGQAKQPNNNAAQPSAATQQPSQSPSPSASIAPAKQEKSIQVYYSDETASKLEVRTVTIRYENDQAKYAEAFKALQTGPDKQAIPLCAGLTLKSATAKDGALVLDVSLNPDGQLGSNGEAMLLQALQKTLFQFTELKSIDVLLDGKQVESLMGHMDLPHPMHRS